jgi:hypothetical protein
VQASLAAAKLDVANARAPVPAPSPTACSSGGGTVGCGGPNSGQVCVQTGIQMSPTGSGAAGVCGISVSFQYPFRFWLPFTSLNKQQIYLTASAHARMETQ